MKDHLDLNFGLIIAFLLPGFILLYGLSLSFQEIAIPLAATSSQETSLGSFLFALLASLALGLLVSAVRWLVIDLPFQKFGKTQKKLDFSKLSEEHCYAAFIGIVEAHYRYYQYYSNCLIAIATSFTSYICIVSVPGFKWWVAILGTAAALLLAARDCLYKYHERASAVLGNC